MQKTCIYLFFPGSNTNLGDFWGVWAVSVLPSMLYFKSVAPRYQLNIAQFSSRHSPRMSLGIVSHKRRKQSLIRLNYLDTAQAS